MEPRFKLALGVGIVVAATSVMAYVGASASWDYYVTVAECAARAGPLAGQRVRVSGGIEPGSLRIAADRSQARFRLQDGASTLNVVCRGPLPDNLTENAEVVVAGRLKADGQLCGDQVLTRCASKYESQRSEEGP
ncbi:MAG: cytochrome c maturation protein CcmE [Candidatus Anammoximicrobium sp.]|nr:cytochrome c maturation protein CcmE [Candidatus Anammoximicrobium sp.]